MAREIKTLEAIVADVRSETGRSRSRNFGIDEYERIKYLIQRQQRLLWWDYDWQFMRCVRDLDLNPGQRYYDYPPDLSFEAFVSVHVLFGEDYVPLISGITPEDYALYNSDNDERCDPVMKWDVVDTGAKDQLEFWPLPDGAQKVRFYGTKALKPFIADNDVCTLDATVLTLAAATALEPSNEETRAALNKLLPKIKSREARITPSNKISMAGGSCPPNRSSAKRVVVVKG